MRCLSPVLLLVLLLLLLPVLCGCASLRALIPGGVSPQDAEFAASVTGPPVSIVASLDSRAAQIGALLPLFGQQDPLGVFLPVTRPGETLPVYLLCPAGKFADKCRRIPLHSLVQVAGQAVGPGGGVWRLSRLTASGFND